MNTKDLNELTEYWHRETNYVNGKVDDAFKSAQDHAYALGLARGRAEAAEMAASRVRDTVILEGGSVEELREAIAARVADVGKPTAWTNAALTGAAKVD